MNGTSFSVTLPMRLMPPSSTMATSMATTTPTMRLRVGRKLFTDGVVRQHGGINGRDDGVDLSGVAGAKDRQHAKQGVQHRQELPALPQAVFNIVHGAAHQLPVFVPLPEMDGQRHLRKLGAHAQQRRAPHPEHGTRPADGDGTRHARDVAGAHRRRQCGADGLERGHGAVRGILFAEHPANGGADGVGEFADLQKAGPHTEQQTHADDAHHGRDPPDKAVDRLIDGRNGFDHMFVSPVTWIFNTTEDILSYFRGGVNLYCYYGAHFVQLRIAKVNPILLLSTCSTSIMRRMIIMLCQNCGKNEANVRYTQIVNGTKKEMVLCEECAEKMGIGGFKVNMPIHFSNFFDDFFDDEQLLPSFMKEK